MHERDRVSIVVPTRNSARTLDACLTSIARQTHRDLEVIVVDNFSTDETRAIASRHECSLLKIGPERSAQRNHGARHATGSHLLFIDSDMVLERRVVEECVAAARAGASALIIPEVSFGEGFWARCKRLERSCYIGDDDIEAARFYARDLFRELGGYDEDLHAAEDWDLGQRARAAGATIDRVQSVIHHDEGRLELAEIAVRKFGYGKSLPAYRTKHRRAAGRQFRLVRPAFIRHRRAFAAEPVVAAGVLALKTLEFSAGAAGALMALVAPAGRSRSDQQDGADGSGHAEEVADRPSFYDGRARRAVRRYLLGLWLDAEAAYRDRILDVIRDAEPEALLDLGCHEGSWTRRLAKAAGPTLGRLSGIEIVEPARREAERKGVEAIAADLNEPLPYEAESFDLVHANQVIEHIRDLDLFVSEIRRVLRPGGRAIVCTENLASWHNLAALSLGYMPFSLTNISTEGAVGNPLNIASVPASELDPAWFHTRVLTGVGLTHLFELHGLPIVARFASGYHPLPSTLAALMARLDFRHAAFIGVVAQKPATTRFRQ